MQLLCVDNFAPTTYTFALRSYFETPSYLALPTCNYALAKVNPIPAQKEGISDSMRERLMREANTGLDPDRKQTNVLLYIMLGVAVLVILGGQGIFY